MLPLKGEFQAAESGLSKIPNKDNHCFELNADGENRERQKRDADPGQRPQGHPEVLEFPLSLSRIQSQDSPYTRQKRFPVKTWRRVSANRSCYISSFIPHLSFCTNIHALYTAYNSHNFLFPCNFLKVPT